MPDHPAVDGGHEVVAFRGGQELVRGHQLLFLVAHAQQDFEETIVLLAVLQREDRLLVEQEALFLECGLDAVDPAEFSLPVAQDLVGGRVDVVAVAPFLLGPVAGRVGHAQEARGFRTVIVDGDHADAHAEGEDLLLPVETEIAHRFQQFARHLLAAVEAAVLEDQPELVATQAPENAAFADGAAQQVRQLLEQFVAGTVSAGVVHHLEAVEVEVHEAVVELAVVDQGAFQRRLEGVAVQEAGEVVLGGLLLQPLFQLAPLGDVPQECREQQPVLLPDAGDGKLHRELGAVGTQCRGFDARAQDGAEAGFHVAPQALAVLFPQ